MRQAESFLPLMRESSPDMALHEDVGRSFRTGAKLRILRDLAGRDIAAAPYVAQRNGVAYANHCIIDLTAGDGSRCSDLLWEHSCSPGIFCHLGSAPSPSGTPHRILLIEKNAAVYDCLLKNLANQLPLLGYGDSAPTVWIHSRTLTRVEVIYGNARDVLTRIEPNPGEWLFVNNDPNNMNGYALDTPLLAGWLKRGDRYGAFMSTLGCNAGGLKRLAREEREGWFTHIRDAQKIIQIHGRLDLLLFEVQNDKSQWAYLLLVPIKWMEKTRADMTRRCKKAGIDVNGVSACREGNRFDEVCRRLFLTNKERMAHE